MSRNRKLIIKLKPVIVALNILMAAISLINLATLAAGAIKVDAPAEEDFAWIVDSEENLATFLADFTVKNHGIYDIDDVNIHAQITDERGALLVDYRQDGLTIPHGTIKVFNISALLPLERVAPSTVVYLLLNDSVFHLHLDITATTMWGLSHFSVDQTLDYPWKSPVKAFAENNTFDWLATEGTSYLFGNTESLELGAADTATRLEMILDEWITGADVTVHVEYYPTGIDSSVITGYLHLEAMNGFISIDLVTFRVTIDGDQKEIYVDVGGVRQYELTIY